MIALSEITIEQMPSKTYPDRKKVFILDFVNDIQIESSWKNLTATAKVIMPKNVYVQTDHGNVSWADSNLYADTTDPVFLRGDKITIKLGYEYQDDLDNWVTSLTTEFTGFITKINPKIPMEIDCEDNMWLLKQAQCPNMVFPASQYNTKSILQFLLLNATVTEDNPYLTEVIIPMLPTFNVRDGVGDSEKVTTGVGDFRTQNETICQVLNRLKKDYELSCFFRGTDLFVSGIVYYPQDYLIGSDIFSTHFNFEENITENEMIYVRMDDMRLGIKAYSVNKQAQTTLNSAGKQKTKNIRIETKVGDMDGEIRTQFFWDVKNEEDLKKLATQRLNKLKYEGWRGTFTSFGLPAVFHGQAISLESDITPERKGIYLVKGTKVSFNKTNGFKRTIEPHLRIDTKLSITDFANGL